MAPSPSPAARPSLVDTAEVALRNWLVPGRHRAGDRLPPEHDLAAMLGISRGTLRTALERLEATGEIVRRQGSGTFVGRVERPAALDEGLERLEPYSSIAKGRGLELTVTELGIAEVGAEAGVAAVLGIEAGTPVTEIQRVLLADGHAAARMVDTIHPDVRLPPEARLRKALERGEMVLDVVLAQGVDVAYAATTIKPRLVTARERLGRDLGIERTTAVLELEEIFHGTAGDALYVSRDIFAPGGLDLHVLRWLEAARPAQVNPARGART
jgi:GntR family transcriptional regulator